MSVMTTRVGPVVVNHAKVNNSESTHIVDSRNNTVYLDLEGNSLELAIRFAADYVKVTYPELYTAPLIGKRDI